MAEKSSVEICATNQLSIGVEEGHRCYPQNRRNMINFNKSTITFQVLDRSKPKNRRKAVSVASLDMASNLAQAQILVAATNVEYY
jgi:hypothetical protein